MRLLTAQKEHICAANSEHIIGIGDNYFGNSYNAFCKNCGILKQQGKLIYSNKEQRYLNPDDFSEKDCAYCANKAIGTIFKKPICDDPACHKRALDQGDDGLEIPTIE